MDGVKKEVFRFVWGIRKNKAMILLSLPMFIYILHRLFERFVRLRRGLPIIKLVFVPICILFAAAVVIAVLNIADHVGLRRSLAKLGDNDLRELEDDFRFGNAYLDRSLIIGKKYIISRNSGRLFRIDELSGVFDDIRDTYNIVTMVLAGADDVVKTKIIKAEFKGKSFIHDRRICSIDVHRKYSSCIGETDGYTQLAEIQRELWNKIKGE